MDIFDYENQNVELTNGENPSSIPLAARMRPRNFEEYRGTAGAYRQREAVASSGRGGEVAFDDFVGTSRLGKNDFGASDGNSIVCLL